VAGCLSRLPGIGRRTAERMAVRLLSEPRGLLAELVATLQEAGRQVTACRRCGNLTSVEENPCELCTSPRREGSVVCVVEEPGDVLLIERSGAFHGRYHVLGGKVSPMRGRGPADLRIRALVARVAEEGIREVILALSTDVEGDATASLIGEALASSGVKVSRPASGLPAGSGVRYSDPVTLARAMQARRGLEA